jgi:hypothetical protein
MLTNARVRRQFPRLLLLLLNPLLFDIAAAGVESTTDIER